MTVVSDTTAITTLLKVGQEQILRDLFTTILVPQAVWHELRAYHAELPGFIELRPVANLQRPSLETSSLGKGECEAIQLAQEIHADLLIMDERKGRTAAAGLGLSCASLPALLLEAKSRNLIESARTLLQVLETQGGLYLSEAVKSEILLLAGE